MSLHSLSLRLSPSDYDLVREYAQPYLPEAFSLNSHPSMPDIFVCWEPNRPFLKIVKYFEMMFYISLRLHRGCFYYGNGNTISEVIECSNGNGPWYSRGNKLGWNSDDYIRKLFFKLRREEPEPDESIGRMFRLWGHKPPDIEDLCSLLENIT